jgi:spermidine synthase
MAIVADRTILSRETLRSWYPLFLISAVSLFLELMVIRWVAGEVRLIAYFKNLPLLAAFLGLGIGFGLSAKGPNYRPAFAPLLGVFVALTLVLGRVTSPLPLPIPGGGGESVWFAGGYSVWTSYALFLGIVLIFFLTTMLLFIPLGQATGAEMARHAPVPAYAVNLLASLVGIWVFVLLAYLQTPPVIWFALGLSAIGLYLFTRGGLTPLAMAIFIIAIGALAISGRGIIWSPYNRLEVHDLILERERGGEPIDFGYSLTVQQAFYQVALNLSEDFLEELQGEFPNMQQFAVSYNMPYLFSPSASDVLIVGAGMGNDVAAALRNGAKSVDAVEIDPEILALGLELHPEDPYMDPRVVLIEEDARSFFESTDKQYDLIVFGLLDSHTLLSGYSNVRLDSFVYTVDSFEQVRDHLDEGGVVSVTFVVDQQWIEERIGRMLGEVFGSTNVYVFRGQTGTVFLAGSVSPDRAAEHGLASWRSSSSADDVQVPTDDWPFLYMRGRSIPAPYWQAMLVIMLAVIALIVRSFPDALNPNWHFFLLGAAFLLVEFKTITEMALLFGSTWFVNVLAISGVLMMALLASLIVASGRNVNIRAMYALLFASLAINFIAPADLLVGLAAGARAIASMVMLSAPLFFAGLIFSESLRRAGETSRSLASNLTGSVAGGVLEYGAILWGIKSLYLLAGAIYAAALAAFLVKRK